MASPSKKRDAEREELEVDIADDDSSDFYDESLDSDGSEGIVPVNEVVIFILCCIMRCAFHVLCGLATVHM